MGYNKLASGMAIGMELPISPPRFAYLPTSGLPSGSGVMPPPMPQTEGSLKNKRGLSVVIPANGQKDSLNSGLGSSARINKMSPPPTFGLSDVTASAFLTSPGGQAFPSPTAFLSELQTPTNVEGSLDGMTPGALAQFSWNSPQGQRPPPTTSSGAIG